MQERVYLFFQKHKNLRLLADHGQAPPMPARQELHGLQSAQWQIKKSNHDLLGVPSGASTPILFLYIFLCGCSLGSIRRCSETFPRGRLIAAPTRRYGRVRWTQHGRHSRVLRVRFPPCPPQHCSADAHGGSRNQTCDTDTGKRGRLGRDRKGQPRGR